VSSSEQTTVWYFAYGSNMQRATFCERRGMHPLDWRRGRLDGYRLCFDLPVGPGERGVANIEAASGEVIHGVLFLLTAAELEFLDKTEGVEHGAYDRVPIAVCDESANLIEAFTYRSKHSRKGRKPSARYMRLIVEGAREHSLPDRYIQSQRRFELAVDERKGR
jgi:cation transport regulator ChaC